MMSIDAQKLATFPAFFKVAGQKIVIIGNGAEAYAKLRLLRETSAALVLIADAPEDDLLDFIKEYSLEDNNFVWLAEKFTFEHLYGAVLIFAANGDVGQDKIIADYAHQLKIAVNVVDRPDMCDFFTPALVNRAPISVAIGSEGASPVLAQMIRAQIEALLNPQIGKVAAIAAKLRTLVDNSIAKGLTRRNFWFRFFNGKIVEELERNNPAAAEREAFDLIHAFKENKGRLYLLNAQNLDADQITLHSQRVLLMADGIVYDHSIDEDLLTIGRRDAQRFVAPKNTLDDLECTKLLINLIESGKQIVRLYGDRAQMLRDIALLEINQQDFAVLPSLSDTAFQHNYANISNQYAPKAA
ncbi:NAD(P)-dependent oxidoreductase [Bartonella sp. HY038]|uniref:NAD(P)-dependent oxidoreductase n=1 Tax=Bartonella sp. HY038 TaxID=2759660 RepID=UPI0015F9ADB0|nr:NAD(P)-dependent oxidoreductase [Bartonella sp. HY038]